MNIHFTTKKKVFNKKGNSIYRKGFLLNMKQQYVEK